MTAIPSRREIVIGLGCSSAAEAGEIIALIRSSLALAGLDATQVRAFGSHSRKLDSVALVQTAAHFDVPLRFLDDDELAPGIPGTCEAVASAAGPLVLAKRKSRYATCAIAEAAPGFTLFGFGQPASPNAAMASSTLSTSLAGP